LVNLSSVILVAGIGLAIFFRKDIGDFLNSLKGFGTGDINVSIIPEGVIPPLPPLPDVGKIVFDAGVGAREAVDVAGKTIFDLGVGAREAVDVAGKTIFDLGVEARKGFDVSVAETQKAFEETGKNIFEAGVASREAIFGAGVETQKVIAGVGEGIFEAGVATRTAFDESIQNIQTGIAEAGANIFSFFGGQTQPKMILTKAEALGGDLSTNIIDKKIVVSSLDLAPVGSFFPPITQAEILSGGTPTEATQKRTFGSLFGGLF